MSKPSPEKAAKAALLTALRRSRRLASEAIVSELVIDKWANRADLVTVGDELVGYEIKTRTDKLVRLLGQLESYSQTFERVYVVAATRHMNAILSTIPAHVGIKEIVDFGAGCEVRDVKPAGLSPALSAFNSLQLLPAIEIKRLLTLAGKRPSNRTRCNLVDQAEKLPLMVIRKFLASYLKTRYGRTSQSFMTDVRGRRICANDLQTLRLWNDEKDNRNHISPAVVIDDWSQSTVYELSLIHI